MLSECSFFDRLLCWKEAILASYPFLGLLLIREGLDDLTAGAWAACVSARSVLPTLLKYFFGSESLALLLPRILFALRREARRNFQHGAPSTKNDVPTHAQGRSKGISSFMIVRGKAIFHCYIYVAAFLVKKFNLWGICTQLNGRAAWHVPQDLSNFRLRGNCSFSRNAL